MQVNELHFVADVPTPAEAALQYARQGWHVLPIHHVTDTGCSCGSQDCASPGKHPLTAHGVKDATVSENQIDAWWSQWPSANVGIRTGSVSGIVVIDVDDTTAVERLSALGELPGTRTVTTAKGLHLYFQTPDVKLPPRVALIPGVDVRAENSYVVAPPSVHATGVHYRLVDTAQPIAPMPAWLVKRCSTTSATPFFVEPTIRPEGPFTSGERNERLTSLGGSLVRLGVAGEALDQILLEANRVACLPPLGSEEVLNVARSVERYRRREQVTQSTTATVGEPPSLQAMTVEGFLEVQRPEKRPIVKGLLNERDLVTLAGRRREGKTTFLIQMAMDTADESSPAFLGYDIPEPGRALLVLIEDDPGELQEKIVRQKGNRELGGRLHVITREDFWAHQIPVDITNQQFREVVAALAERHQPRWIALDNISHLVRGDYNDAKVIDALMKFAYEMATAYNSAVVLAAHPRKRDKKAPVRLADEPAVWFEEVMGSSHGINSTGSLWGLERDGDTTIFVGGRQRADGHHQTVHLQLGNDGRFGVVSDARINRGLLLSTAKREKAWALLPETFTYEEGERAVASAGLLAKSAFYDFWNYGKRLGLFIQGDDGKWHKTTQ